MKSEFISFRASAGESLKLAELAKASGLSKSRTLCALISNARIVQQVTNVPTTTISTQTKEALPM